MINSLNEWEPLKKVIVGIADHARIPLMDISLRTVNYADRTELDLHNISHGNLYPTQVIQETNEDLNRLTEELTSLDIEVVRPDNNPTEYYNYCPRDLVTIVNNECVVAPMSLIARDNEYKNIEKYLTNLHIVPNNTDTENYNLDCIGDKDTLALNEIYPKFDAANILRANDTILYLVSNSGNKKGAEYLQNHFGNKVKVKLLEKVYSYMHIDSTVAFLREGLLLVNPARIKDHKTQLPEPFNKWDCIYCPDPIDIGYYPGFCNASEWINMNLLSINENLVVLEEHQKPLQYELQRYNIESLMLPMRHQRTLGGGFHCVTLDLIRESK